MSYPGFQRREGGWALHIATGHNLVTMGYVHVVCCALSRVDPMDCGTQVHYASTECTVCQFRGRVGESVGRSRWKGRAVQVQGEGGSKASVPRAEAVITHTDHSGVAGCDTELTLYHFYVTYRTRSSRAGERCAPVSGVPGARGESRAATVSLTRSRARCKACAVSIVIYRECSCRGLGAVARLASCESKHQGAAPRIPRPPRPPRPTPRLPRKGAA